MKPGADVWVDFEGGTWPAEVIKGESSSGYVLCKVHFNDPAWDFGRGGGRVVPVQTVAVRVGSVRPREDA